jgi:hypothetical protein
MTSGKGMLSIHGRKRVALALAIAATLALSILSLVLLSPYDEFHIFYSDAKLAVALLWVGAFSLVSLLFVFADFSLGYMVGFHLYLMLFGYLWLGVFSDLPYDHPSASLSAAISGFAFLAPALFIRAPIARPFGLSGPAVEKLLWAIVALAGAVLAAGAIYNFRVVSLLDIYQFRNELQFPSLLKYLIGITTGTLLPFAFACFVLRGAYWRALIVVVTLLLYYPVTLSKTIFFEPFWLIYVTLLSRLLGSRLTVVLALAAPLLTGVLLMAFAPDHAYPFSHIFNLRLFAIPSTAMDFYNHFFAHHDLTYFCQISVVKRLLACPYQEPLALVMQDTYSIGNLTASLFATEGVASLGIKLAPLAALFCGLIFALANRLSAGLPSRFVLISGAMLPLLLNDVPLSIVLLTHGAGALFLFWYLMPRDYFPPAKT